MNNIQHYRKLSVEEMNRIVLEKIPLEERLRSVYLPIIAMDCACYLAEDLLTIMGTLRLENTKRVSRIIRSCVEGYRKDNYDVMRSDLYRNLENSTKKFYTSISRDMVIHQVQYRQALLDKGIHLEMDVAKMIAITYIIRGIVELVVELDRSFSKRISDLLGKDIHYTTEDNHHCTILKSTLTDLLHIMNVPDSLKTSQTTMAFMVFKNRLNSIRI